MKSGRSAVMIAMMSLAVFSLVAGPGFAGTTGQVLVPASQFPNDIVREAYVPSLYYYTAGLVEVSQFPAGVMGEVYVPSLYYDGADVVGATNVQLVAIDDFPHHLGGECYCPPLYYDTLVVAQK